jgi:PHD/YefM family antitoxin component YafN of YafNO toxin-antitoxin module
VKSLAVRTAPVDERLPVGAVVHTGAMAESMPLAAVVAPFQSLVRRAARQRERITIVDPDEPSAVVISAEELEDLEDALAVAQSRLRETDGETVWVAHEEVKQRLGFDR